MTESKTIRLARPYHSIEAYLQAEGWTIKPKGMVLVDQSRLPSGTIVRFEVVLASGEKPIRAEGRVVGFVEPTDERPGGVRVRFNRLGASSKSFIDRVLAERGTTGGVVVTDPEPMSLRAPPPEAPSTPPQRDSRERIRVPLDAPANREELLQRLRERSRRGS